MQKRELGPDLVDVRRWQTSIEEQHHVKIRVELATTPSRNEPNYQVVVEATYYSEEMTCWLIKCYKQSIHPCNGHRTLEGLLMRLLTELDCELSKGVWV